MAVSPFTGQDDGVSDTLQPIVGAARNVGQGINDSLLRDPESRSALLQIGLGLMQPTAMGQTTGGALGQAVGSGGEAVGRIEAEQLAERKVEDELSKSNRALDIRQQEANAYTAGQRNKATTDRLTLEQLKQQGREALQGTKNYHNAAIETFKAVQNRTQDPLYDPSNPDPFVESYKGKSIPEIERMMREGDTGVAAPPSSAPPSAVAAPSAGAPPKDRVPGQVYPTPRGKMKWTGTGWVEP